MYSKTFFYKILILFEINCALTNIFTKEGIINIKVTKKSKLLLHEEKVN